MIKHFYFSALLAGILMLTVSCADNTSSLQRSNIDVPPQWTAPAKDGSLTREWWKDFNDRELDNFINNVLENNHSLKAAAENVIAAAAQAEIAGADGYPQISAGIKAARVKQNYVGFPIPGKDGVISVLTSSFGTSLDISWEPDIWGRISKGKTAAAANFGATGAELEAARLSLTAQAVKAWFTMVELNIQIQTSSDIIENRKKRLELTEIRFNSGLAPAVAVYVAEAELTAAETEHSRLLALADSMSRQMEILSGKYPSGAMPESYSLPQIAGAMPAGIPASLISRRPDLTAAELRVLASGALADQSRTNLYPRIILAESAGTYGSELSNLLDGDFSVWSIAGNILQPIFQGGRIRAGIKTADARHRQSIEAFADAALNAFAEVESSLAAEGFLAEQVSLLESSYNNAATTYKSVLTRFDLGIADADSLLNAEYAMFQSKRLLVSAQRGKLDARINLILALGGGYDSTAAPPDGVKGGNSGPAETVKENQYE